MGVVSGLAMALGPSLGGGVTSLVGWRWIFLANVVPCALIALAVPRLAVESWGEHDRPVDWGGMLLLTLALGVAGEALLRAREPPLDLLVGLAGCLVPASGAAGLR